MSTHGTQKSGLAFVAQQLITKEDPLFVHKTLGILVLLSYAWRLSQIGENDMAFAMFPEWTIPSLVLHLSLNLSSFEFCIPAKRIKDGSRIWPEYRLHSLVFLTRALACIAVNWYEQHYQLAPNYTLNLWIVLGAMVAGDVSSYSVGDKHSDSIRDLSAPVLVKYYFSVAQFFATTMILFGSRRSSLLFYIAFVIQLTPFLMTLRRKNLLQHGLNIFLYGSLLAGGMRMGIYEYVYFGANPGEVTTLCVVSLVACTAALWRLGPGPSGMLRNKYLIWTVMYFWLNQVLRPVLEGQEEKLTKSCLHWLALGEFAMLVMYGLYKQACSQQQRHCVKTF